MAKCIHCGSDLDFDDFGGDKFCQNCGANIESDADIIKGKQEISLDYQKVIVTDIEMSFNSMVNFMVKWAIASIPAFIILSIIWLIIDFIFSPIFL